MRSWRAVGRPIARWGHPSKRTPPALKLLHIDSSIQGDASASRAISSAIVDRLRALHPGLEVAHRDLARDPLPHVTLDRLGAEASNAAIEELLAADILVIGAPMYNFGIPTQLKAWFDHVLVAGRTFRYSADGPEGLAGAKRVFIVQPRGGIYSSGEASAAEHAESHLRTMLGFIGIADPHVILIEGVAFGPEQRDAALEAARQQVAAIGAA
jgi:FMN-dependent NADH-azoreductase